MRRHYTLAWVLNLALSTAAVQVLAQAPAPPPDPVRTWSHLLTATLPEASHFTSVSFGYALAYGSVFAVGAHVGPAFRPENTSSFAPFIWGHTAGGSLHGAGDLGADLALGGYVRIDRMQAGFSYQSFSQNLQNPDPNITVAGATQQARFRQTLGEVGGLLRFDDGGRWVMQLEAGIAVGKRGMFTPSDIYPGYRLDSFDFFGTTLPSYNEYHDTWGPRSRVMVAYRIGGLR